MSTTHLILYIKNVLLKLIYIFLRDGRFIKVKILFFFQPILGNGDDLIKVFFLKTFRKEILSIQKNLE